MSKTKTILLATCLALGNQAAQAMQGEINDPFFLDPATVVTFQRVVIDDGKPEAVLNGVNGAENRTTAVTPVQKLNGWLLDDAAKTAQQKVKYLVFKGEMALSLEKTLPNPAAYVPGAIKEVRSAELMPNTIVTVFEAQDFTRPDGSILTEQRAPLYRLQLTENRQPLPVVQVCNNEFQTISQFKKKTRHNVTFYTATSVSTIQDRLPLEAMEPRINLSTTNFIELKVSYSEEAPQCNGALKHPLPANYRII